MVDTEFNCDAMLEYFDFAGYLAKIRAAYGTKGKLVLFDLNGPPKVKETHKRSMPVVVAPMLDVAAMNLMIEQGVPCNVVAFQHGITTSKVVHAIKKYRNANNMGKIVRGSRASSFYIATQGPKVLQMFKDGKGRREICRSTNLDANTVRRILAGHIITDSTKEGI